MYYFAVIESLLLPNLQLPLLVLILVFLFGERAFVLKLHDLSDLTLSTNFTNFFFVCTNKFSRLANKSNQHDVLKNVKILSFTEVDESSSSDEFGLCCSSSSSAPTLASLSGSTDCSSPKEDNIVLQVISFLLEK